jgi:hypothetical protein
MSVFHFLGYKKHVSVDAVFTLHVEDTLRKANNVVVHPWRAVINSLHKTPAPGPVGGSIKTKGKKTTYHLLKYGKESPSTDERLDGRCTGWSDLLQVRSAMV